MLESDFNRYSLAIVKDDKIIHSSSRPGLRPLFEAVREYKDKLSNCILHDRVIGLAAARLVVFSKIFKTVLTGTISEPGKKLLQNNSIEVHADKTVKNILTKDKMDICPMEQKAMKIDDNEEFYDILKRLMER